MTIMAGESSRQKRVKPTSYLDGDISDEDIQRRTQCACDRPAPIAEIHLNSLGRIVKSVTCMKCGREVRGAR